LRIRNGKPGVWDVRWEGGKFQLTSEDALDNQASSFKEVAAKSSFDTHKKAG
jgi:hypothetical protein